MKAVRIKLWERSGGIISSGVEGFTDREVQEFKDAIEKGYKVTLYPEKRVESRDPYYTLRITPCKHKDTNNEIS